MSEDGVKWDAKLLPVIKCVLGKKGIEHRDAAEVDKMKVDFFRGKDFVEFMLRHDSVLKRHCQPALDAYLEGNCPADAEDVGKIGSALIEKGFIVKAQYRPLVEGHDDSERRKKKFWPDRLVRREGAKTFDPTGYYIILYEGSQTWRNLMLAGMILLIMAACLFPVWPTWARIWAWYVLLLICTLWMMLEFTRLGSFCAGWVVGVEFWILPNFNDEYCSVADSFKPIYSFERRRDGWMMLLTRLVVFLVVGLAIEEASKTHSISDVQDFVTSSYMDIMQWGENKALMLEGASQKMALPNLADLEKEEEEERKKESQKTADADAEPSAFDEDAADAGGEAETEL